MNDTIQTELGRRTAVRIANTTNAAMETFRRLVGEIDCMDDIELEVFQNKLLSYGMVASQARRKNFAAGVHDATISFLEHNR